MCSSLFSLLPFYLPLNDPMIPLILIALGVALASILGIHRYRALNSVPGPFLASLTDLWLFGRRLRHESWRETTQRLHEKYGAVVRLGPKRVIFKDLDALSAIYGSQPLLPKSDAYQPIAVAQGGQILHGLFSMQDERSHSSIRKPIAYAFNAKAVLKYEDCINHTAGNLVTALRRQGASVDLAEWLRYFTADSLMRIAFSKDLGFISTGSDVNGILGAIADRFEHFWIWAPLLLTERLLFKNPIASRISSAASPLATKAADIVSERIVSTESSSKADLLAIYLDMAEKQPQIFNRGVITGLVMSTVQAGADTTANTISLVLYHLLRNPEKLRKLRQEIGMVSGHLIRPMSEVSDSAYLDAVIKETMRISSISGGPMEKKVPSTGLVISGCWMPPGTSVSVSHHCLNFDERVYGPDPKAFIPERWLEADKKMLQTMLRANMSFSLGKRACLGQNLAMLELKKMVPFLLEQFPQMMLISEDLKLNYGQLSFVEEMKVRLDPSTETPFQPLLP